MDIELNNRFLNAALNNNMSAVKTFLNIPGFLPNYTNKSGHTALIWAARRGHTIMVKTLLSAPGIFINQSSSDGSTALIWAAKNGNRPAVEALLSAPGILIDQKNHAGKSASAIAFEHHHFDIVTLLKQKPGIPAAPKEPINTTLPTLVKPKRVTFSLKAKAIEKPKAISVETINKSDSKTKPTLDRKTRSKKRLGS